MYHIYVLCFYTKVQLPCSVPELAAPRPLRLYVDRTWGALTLTLTPTSGIFLLSDNRFYTHPGDSDKIFFCMPESPGSARVPIPGDPR